MGEKTEQQTAQPLGSHSADHQATVPALLRFMVMGLDSASNIPLSPLDFVPRGTKVETKSWEISGFEASREEIRAYLIT